MDLTDKQKWALQLMTDGTTSFIGYGGAAGGGKSILGCFALMTFCNIFKGSKWFIGRDSLKDTRESVLFTWRKVSQMNNLEEDNWKYSDNHIYFKNGSEIEFLDLSFYPQKDPLYERFGSKEYTGGWIEEAGNVNPQAFEILKTRINRWYNKDYGIRGKILVTFNPKKNWLYKTFYLPYRNKTETDRSKFIPALAMDNPYLDEEYIENLQNLKDKSTKERLLYGNFDYDDDPSALMSYQQITAIWKNDHVPEMGTKYIIVDAARYGSDKAIVMVWEGFRIIEVHVFPISSTVDIQNCINAMRSKHGIGSDYVLVDDDGVGGGIVDNCRVLGFKNNGRPRNPSYNSIKDECGYKLAEFIDEIYFEEYVDEETSQTIEEELGQLKTYDSDKDGKLRLLPKNKIKENIGRSPDWLDVFLMRMYFELDFYSMF